MPFCSSCGSMVEGTFCPRCGAALGAVQSAPAGQDALVHPNERVYFVLCLAASILAYLILVVTIVGILYVLLGGLVVLIATGLFLGRIRANGIRVSERQFPEVYVRAVQLAQAMNLRYVPDIYVLQAGGLLNAFAARLLGRHFVILYSDVLELAYDKGEEALGFVIAHELAHIKRGHLLKRVWLLPGLLVPFLGKAYMRACEYTCDRFGAAYQPGGAVAGLLVLAAGKKLYGRVNVEEYQAQAHTETGFFVWLSEIVSTHPNLTKRVRAIGPARSFQASLGA